VARDCLTEETPADLGLSERQIKAVVHVKIYARITNKDYRELTGTTIRTASQDLEDLFSKAVLSKAGVTGRNADYVLARKQDVKRTNRTFNSQRQKWQ